MAQKPGPEGDELSMDLGGGTAGPCWLDALYPIQKLTEIYNKITEMYKKVAELEILSWNVLFLLRSEVAYIGTGPILP